MAGVTERDLDGFFKRMKFYLDVSHKARDALASETAYAFSVFDYIEPDENRLSKIIADLLNPRGKHGQGGAFLRAFLEMLDSCGCCIPEDIDAKVDEAIVVREAATTSLADSARRIDIRIEFPGGFGIGIENKPWAGEQPGQLEAYAKELYRGSRGNYVLVFLCKRGHIIVSLSPDEKAKLEQEGKFAIVHYSGKFLGWLRTCRKRAEAEKVRFFLKDLARYVEDWLLGEELTEKSDVES